MIESSVWRDLLRCARPLRHFTRQVLHGRSALPLVAILISGNALSQAARPAAPMSVGREYQTATLLRNGDVLVTGGYSQPPARVLGSTEAYDVMQNKWIAEPPLLIPRFEHTATLLRSGKVLVVGGVTALPRTGTEKALADIAAAELSQKGGLVIPFVGKVPWEYASATAESYDPSVNRWARVASLRSPRIGHTATLLRNGDVLVVGGDTGYGSELYNAGTDSWTRTQSPLVPLRGLHTATILRTGQVLVVGGVGVGGALASAELYNPATHNWSLAGTLSTPRYSHVATLLPSGEVIVAGGWLGVTPLASAEMYNPATNTWAPAAALQVARAMAAAEMQNGQWVVLGGWRNPDHNALASVEEYDPVSRIWRSGAALIAPRQLPTATALRGNGLLIVGGVDAHDPAVILASAELR